VRLIIADTSPINYLLLIGHIEILPALFERVILPAVVCKELRHPKAPKVVAAWIANPPAWVEIRQVPSGSVDNMLIALDPGEEDAIALALELHADLLLIDDEDGVLVARSKGLEVTGTLGLLSRAAQRGLVDLADAFERLKRTNFRCRQEVMNRFLAGQRS
jgi:predicted nucleic acid-binding protein